MARSPEVSERHAFQFYLARSLGYDRQEASKYRTNSPEAFARNVGIDRQDYGFALQVYEARRQSPDAYKTSGITKPAYEARFQDLLGKSIIANNTDPATVTRFKSAIRQGLTLKKGSSGSSILRAAGYHPGDIPNNYGETP